MSYRPITDSWILARPKVAYYGAYPNGYLERARALLPVMRTDPVLHVCGGRVRDYPVAGGFGPNDRTLDLDPALAPDFLQDARRPFPLCPCRSCTGGRERNGNQCPICTGSGVLGHWRGILIDRPYTLEDAAHYQPGPGCLPTLSELMNNALEALWIGGRVGFLDYMAPRPPKVGGRDRAKFIAKIDVFVGYGNRGRIYSVFEKLF